MRISKLNNLICESNIESNYILPKNCITKKVMFNKLIVDDVG